MFACPVQLHLQRARPRNYLVARTLGSFWPGLSAPGYWLEWWRRFGPASGSDPKLADPLLRYVLTTFTYGANMGPAQAARHIRGVSAHELGATAARHFTTRPPRLTRA